MILIEEVEEGVIVCTVLSDGWAPQEIVLGSYEYEAIVRYGPGATTTEERRIPIPEEVRIQPGQIVALGACALGQLPPGDYMISFGIRHRSGSSNMAVPYSFTVTGTGKKILDCPSMKGADREEEVSSSAPSTTRPGIPTGLRRASA